ncbi:DMT family transporter [Thetidibacter halocola]|uniref:DMT family transporter n=1 Tax=Thetidibacter halocola TaxID=2827239 RepID=A0A8J7WJH4_9RHOB|nr:DMT family transporter [Thetidibacter halocola]MBS0126144.1 DMT family transporter [Thetidibacter halocola]
MTRLAPFLALAVIGAAWGATQPLAKVAVSTGHAALGLLFWQLLIGAVVLGGITLARGRALSLTPAHLRLYLVIALVGSVLPGITSYNAARHLPAGVLSILLSSVPMWAFPIALALGNDRFHVRRLLGLALGLAGVSLIVLPTEGLPPAVPALWVGIALLSSVLYAIEGNVVQRWGTYGLDPMQVLAGASAVGAVLCLPLALAGGVMVDPRSGIGAPEIALIASALLHAAAYSGYVWLVGVAGSVFAVQVSYFVTLFGVIWAMAFLSEGYSGWIWAALALMLAGLALVQPQPKRLVPDGALGQNATG